jgi:hypothetical protein
MANETDLATLNRLLAELSGARLSSGEHVDKDLIEDVERLKREIVALFERREINPSSPPPYSQ